MNVHTWPQTLGKVNNDWNVHLKDDYLLIQRLCCKYTCIDHIVFSLNKTNK